MRPAASRKAQTHAPALPAPLSGLALLARDT
jgi:hypothetical protein